MRHANDEKGDQKGGAEKGRGETGAGMERGGGHGSNRVGPVCRTDMSLL